MQSRRLTRLALASTATVAALISAAALPATATTPGASGVRGLESQLRFSFDNGESLRAGTRVRDVSGQRHHGVVRKSGRGHLTVERGIVRRGAGFPSACRRCGRAIIEVPDRKGMEPRRRAFSFGAAVRVTPRQARPGREPNIIQKGKLGQPGGQWKLELVGARPRCILTGGMGKVRVTSPRPIDDRRWHRVACTRAGWLVSLRLDGAVVASGRGATGRIANAAPVRIGGKAVGRAAGNDQFHGNLDSVFLSIKRRS